ncbi:hypothetical protein BHE74_00045042 [Ensete ventricosum]|nr:hypothetical protein GW17_00041805 [Ensete ventricosum]RWW48849.1 hypothetical protein BHE74_00045042 [Ensete ventricosum]
MPSPLRNGDAAHPRLPSPAAPSPLHHHNHNYPSFRSTVSEQKIRRLNLLILLLRLAAFCFSLSAAVFTAANSSRSASSPYSWLSFDSFRVMFAANAIVAVYSLLEMCASIREILHGATLLPEPMQLWFDFAHDQVPFSAPPNSSSSLSLSLSLSLFRSILLTGVGTLVAAVRVPGAVGGGGGGDGCAGAKRVHRGQTGRLLLRAGVHIGGPGLRGLRVSRPLRPRFRFPRRLVRPHRLPLPPPVTPGLGWSARRLPAAPPPSMPPIANPKAP